MAEESQTVQLKLRTGLSDITLLTRQILEAIVSSDQGGVQSMSNVVDKLIKRNSEIQALADTAIEMRLRQEEIDRVSSELEVKRGELLSLQSKLQETEKILEEAAYKGKQKLDSISAAKNGSVSPELLIRYAHRISQASSTVSPVGWQPNDPRRPFPQDIEMRSGHLGRLTSGQGSIAVPVANGSTVTNSRAQVTGFNHNNNNNPPERRGFQTTSTNYEEPEVMTEDTSESSSDEG